MDEWESMLKLPYLDFQRKKIWARFVSFEFFFHLLIKMSQEKLSSENYFSVADMNSAFPVINVAIKIRLKVALENYWAINISNLISEYCSRSNKNLGISINVYCSTFCPIYRLLQDNESIYRRETQNISNFTKYKCVYR